MENGKLKEWTYEDYLALPEDSGIRYEIIDGELYITPSGSHSPEHQKITGALFAMFWNFLRNKKIGEIFFGPCDVILSRSPFQIVIPDLVIVSSDRAGIIMKQNIQGIPDLIVEILSEGTGKCDRQEKLSLYKRSGVPEYWIVDPKAEAVQIFRLSDGRYGTPLEFRKDADLDSTLLPGLSIPLAQVFPA